MRYLVEILDCDGDEAQVDQRSCGCLIRGNAQVLSKCGLGNLVWWKDTLPMEGGLEINGV